MKSKTQKDDGAGCSISQMCERTGYTADTLRFYEKAGLLPGVRREGGRRVYTDEDYYSICIITCLKKTGLPLDEIRRYMDLTKRGERSVGQRLELMRRHETEIKKQIAELRVCEERIAFKVWYYETAQREGLKAVMDIGTTLERYRRETGRKVEF